MSFNKDAILARISGRNNLNTGQTKDRAPNVHASGSPAQSPMGKVLDINNTRQ